MAASRIATRWPTTSKSRRGDWRFQANAYALDYQLDLFSNFTYAINAAEGDQFEQFDDRKAFGLHSEIARDTQWGGMRGQLKIGFESRFDDIGRVGLYLTDDRARLATIREDSVERLGLGFFIEQQLRPTDWLRVIAGLRHDRADFDVRSDLDVNSGSADDNITSPKLSFVFGPWAETEFFVNAGRGFHENDARGTTITVDPADGVTAVDRVHPMVRASGAEIGLRTALVPYTQLALTAWTLDLDSELLYVGDAGATEANRASERRGVELGVYVTPREWLTAGCRPRLVAWALQRVRCRRRSHPRRGRTRRLAWALPCSTPAAGLVARASGISARRRSSRTVQRALRPHHGGEPRRSGGASASVSRSRWRPTTCSTRRTTTSHISTRASCRARAAPVSDRHFHPVEPRTLRMTVETRW